MIKTLIREYVKALLEMGPIASDDTAGMVTFTRPSTDPDDIEAEFDRDQFIGLTRRVYKDARSGNEHPDVKKLTKTFADQQRKITGVEVDQEDLESELGHAEQEQDDFGEADPQTKANYYADPKWYTKYF